MKREPESGLGTTAAEEGVEGDFSPVDVVHERVSPSWVSVYVGDIGLVMGLEGGNVCETGDTASGFKTDSMREGATATSCGGDTCAGPIAKVRGDVGLGVALASYGGAADVGLKGEEKLGRNE